MVSEPIQNTFSGTEIDFEVTEFGLYAVSITVSCNKNDSVAIRIDSLSKDSELITKGNTQNRQKEILVFVTTLDQGNHQISIQYSGQPNVEEWHIVKIAEGRELRLDVRAEDEDRRRWYVFRLLQLPIANIQLDASVMWHFWDGDNIKLVIDGQIVQNSASKLWKNWLFSARPWNKFVAKRENKTLVCSLPLGNHSIELWSDKTPILHSIRFDFGDFIVKRVPSVSNPKWTGNFQDDPDEVILARALYGEARSTLVPDEARRAIAWVIRNRVKGKRWPGTYWEVITEPSQFSSFNPDDPNRQYVETPLFRQNDLDRSAWMHAYTIALETLQNDGADPTNGANHYFDDSIDTPPWASGQTPTLTITYRIKSGREAHIFFFKL